DEEAEDLAERVAAHVQPVPGGVAVPTLLFGKCVSATGFLAHQLADAAAEMRHEVEEFVPELAVAEAGDDGEVEADILDRAADGTTACLALKVLQGRHEQFGIVPAGGTG